MILSEDVSVKSSLTVDPQLSRTGLEYVFLKNERFSADAQNYTTMRVVVTYMQFWTAVSPHNEI